MPEVTALALLVGALYAVQNLLRYAKAADWNGVIGILLAFVGGLVVVVLGAHSDATAALHLIKGGPSLGALDGGGQILLGISVGSAGTVLADVRNALDGSTSAAKPPIVGPS